jgi:hypothetical protein
MGDNAKRILLGDSEQLTMVQEVFEQCCDIKGRDLVQIIKDTQLNEGLLKIKEQSALVNASEKFIKSFSE